jgi:muramidase (phage lysozyme)
VSDPIELIAASTNQNVYAFLKMLRHGEGTSDEDGYRRMFGGELFDSFADHPRKAITKKLGGSPITSTAAGAYQFLSRTWDGLVKQYGFADFSPKNQDLAGIALIKGRKALDDVIAGRFETAVLKCNKEWASLPGSPYGQPVVTMTRAKKEYEAHGGTYSNKPQSAPLVILGPEPQEPVKEKPMAPFIAAALPVLIDIVPKLATMFSSGSETSQRNIKAAEIVVEAAKEAIGARNEQELVEAIKNDPQQAELVKQAIETVWYKLDEVGGGIQAARVANEKFTAPDAKGFWHQPAFWMSLFLMPLVYGVAYRVLWTDVFSTEVQSMVIAAIISGVLGSITGYWLGTSFSSQKKTELMGK